MSFGSVEARARHAAERGRAHGALKGVTLFAYLFLWLGGALTYALGLSPPPQLWWTAPLFLVLAGAIALWGTAGRERVDALIAAAIGFTMELFGVKAGLPFGSYRYTDVLWPQAFGVPLVIALAWMLLALYARDILSTFDHRPLLRWLFASALMVAFDLVIDPLAAGPLGYWQWEEGGMYYGIPTKNFFGWFVTGAIIFALFGTRWRRRGWSHFAGASVMLFFASIAASRGYVVPCALGLALVGLAAWRRFFGSEARSAHD
ncbi:carotenoid biosynthesis protein [Pyrinomonas sp.]|uniref:carotenoid biosynthesis protein n=1 Tax=Pyrinomonas sp. TaxID=2080306 RepID=UPI00332D5D99